MKLKKIYWSLIGMVIVSFLFSIFAMPWYLAKRDIEISKEKRHLIFLLEEEFKKDIERAKRVTADPCARVFYDLVLPPKGLSIDPSLVIMGEEIDQKLDPSAYFLSSKGDKIELMKKYYYKDPLLSRKVGEKYSFDSKSCRGKRSYTGTEF